MTECEEIERLLDTEEDNRCFTVEFVDEELRMGVELVQQIEPDFDEV